MTERIAGTGLVFIACMALGWLVGLLGTIA